MTLKALFRFLDFGHAGIPPERIILYKTLRNALKNGSMKSAIAEFIGLLLSNFRKLKIPLLSNAPSFNYSEGPRFGVQSSMLLFKSAKSGRNG